MAGLVHEFPTGADSISRETVKGTRVSFFLPQFVKTSSFWDADLPR